MSGRSGPGPCSAEGPLYNLLSRERMCVRLCPLCVWIVRASVHACVASGLWDQDRLTTSEEHIYKTALGFFRSS